MKALSNPIPESITQNWVWGTLGELTEKCDDVNNVRQTGDKKTKTKGIVVIVVVRLVMIVQ